MRDLAAQPKLCAVNTATFGFQAPLSEVIEEIARAGFGGVGPWRREIEGQDVKTIGRQIRDAGLSVTGFCRSPYLPANSRAAFVTAIESNYRALDEAAALHADSYVIVSGSLPEGSKDLSAARAQVAEGVALLCAYAAERDIKIALEPLHPVYAVDRSCINLLSQALDICAEINAPNLGVCIDVYHTWWDPNLARDIARAGREKRIISYHVSDWLSPTIDVLNDRGMMGDGVIDLKSFRHLMENAGYDGLVEVELFSAENWWKKPIAETLGVLKERFATVV